MGLLRFLLALSVVISHFGPIFGLQLVGGQIAVQSFFIISGFYMSLILNEKYIGVNNSYKLFITNRFIRLYPIYWAVLILVLVGFLAFYIVGKGQYTTLNQYFSVKSTFLSMCFLIVSNLLIFGQDLVMFLGIDPTNGHLFFTENFNTTTPPLYTFLFIPQAWTLSLELTFYLFAPFILRKGYKVVITLITVSFILRLFLYNYFNLQNDPWTYRFFPTEIMFFLFGYLSYRLHLILKEKSIPKALNRGVFAFILLFTLFCKNLPELKVNHFPFTVIESIYFLTIIIAIPLLFNFLKHSKLDNSIGELSYPIYISHILVSSYIIVLARELNLERGWTVALASIVFSLLLNKFIAKPIEKYRQSRLKKG